MTQESSTLRNYEGVVILHPDATEEEQKAFFKKNSDLIKSFKGEVNHLDTWGKRKLANPIEKFTRGVYFHTTFQANGNCISELERTMRINDRVLRFTHVRLDDRQSLSKAVDDFKQALADTLNREKEREAKNAARRAQMGGGGGFGRDRDGGGRDGGGRDRDGGGGFGRDGGGREGGGGFRGRRDEGSRPDFGGDDSDNE